MTPTWSDVKRRGVTMVAAATLLTTSSLGAGPAFADELGTSTDTISAPSIEATLTRLSDDTSVAKRERERRGHDDGAGHAFVSDDSQTVLAKRERERRGGEGPGHALAPTDAPTVLAKRERERRGNDDGAGHAFVSGDSQTVLAKREREQRGGEGAGHA